jgi:hypothetical protein
MLYELRPVAGTTEVVAERELLVRLREERPRLSIESNDVTQHSPEGAPKQVPRLCEDSPQPTTSPLQARTFTSEAEAHVARLGLDSELIQQAREIRVGLLVVDDEARVDGVVLPFDFHIDGMRMPPNSRVRLVHRDLMPLTEQMGGHQAGNATAHDRDSHPRSPREAIRT